MTIMTRRCRSGLPIAKAGFGRTDGSTQWRVKRCHKRTDSSGAPGWAGPPVAVLWTQSLVWGLLCMDTLSVLEVPFRLLSASEICEDCLDAFRILIVPGGWAAHKVRALGETGRLKIAEVHRRRRVLYRILRGRRAGPVEPSRPLPYPDSQNAPVRTSSERKRRDSYLTARFRIPPGRIFRPGFPFLSGGPLNSGWTPAAHACQACLASYADPGVGFQVADLRVCDMDESAGWEELEKAYGINLDPARIKGHPAIIEIEKGKGRLVLSYAHLETPGDRWGNRLFFNILNYLNDVSAVRNFSTRSTRARKA